MADALVIGYGNPLRCDDGLGWKAVDSLAETLDSERIELLTCHQLNPELAETLQDAELVLFLDAAAEGVPGQLHCEPVEPVSENLTLMHSLSPAALLTLCDRLYETSPRAYALSISGQCFEHGDTLSAPVRNAMLELLARARELLDDFLD